MPSYDNIFDLLQWVQRQGIGYYFLTIHKSKDTRIIEDFINFSDELDLLAIISEIPKIQEKLLAKLKEINPDLYKEITAPSAKRKKKNDDSQ